MSVPKSLQPAFDGIEPLITDYCNQYLNDEYRNCVCICSKSSAERGLHRYWQEERTHAVDIALINLCKRGDIVVTQDYGVAALALGKGARAIHQSGKWYTDDNIDGLLMERHLAKKVRRSGKHHLNGPVKRTEEDDRRFAESFERMIQEVLNDRNIVE
jgi:uncharacterized protein YaiI (UPF0178 family)